MGNHFRTVEDGQDAPAANAPGTASHFAYSSPDEDAQTPLYPQADAGMPEPAAPELDPFAYHPEMPTSQVSPFANVPSPEAPAPGDMAAGHTQATGAPAGTNAALASIPSIPDPAEPAVGADQAHEVATLNTALESGDFTSVFAPVGESRKKMAHEAGVEPVIVMEHVTKIYPAQPNKPALEDVNLEVYPGEFVFLVGHSGSGKSTLLRTIMREVKPTSGRVIVAGQDLMRIRNRKVPYLRRQMGIVFQDFRLLPNKTAYENVAFALECIGKPRGVIRAQVPEVLRLVGLADQMNSTPDQLSGGEQQRVNVARAMVNRPPLLICDEPTGNLDPAISLGIMKLLERINRAGTTVIVATHDREMVDSMHRRVIALEAGHVIRDQERGGYGNYGAF
ncbi:cell division ATP-binding protein FtsE [[Collinsella] massiliensis]|uniref:Cell division ATP-binding protein FtsE n=1 Tax=[Collinsella] massiliensis TaxID=1232426 RepID=A0A1Y3XX33_9ACTN|nr:cell division ATP-binding protein FtsE [[Collinsella] massiliensis]OUN88878.1 cell division ATP-binding protein FtsE [[Collinsella] massiliensis]